MGLCRVGRDWRVTRALLVQLRLCRAMLQSGAQSSKIRSRICARVTKNHRPSGAREHGTAQETPSYRAAELQSPRSENLTAKLSRLRRPCTAPPVIASYNNRRCHNKNKNVKKQKCRIFFPGSRPGVIGRFFAAIGGAKFLLFFARSFLTQEELYPL